MSDPLLKKALKQAKEDFDDEVSSIMLDYKDALAQAKYDMQDSMKGAKADYDYAVKDIRKFYRTH